MKRFFSLLIVAVMSLFLFTGCGGDEKTVLVDEDTKATITDSGDGEFSMTVEDDEAGTMSFQGGKNLTLPDNWPKGDLPLFSGSEIVFAMKNTTGDVNKESAMIAIGCDASIPDVTAFYKGKLSGAENFSVMEMDDYVMLSGVKGNVGFSLAVNNEAGSEWTGSKNYPTYVLMTYYQP
jgi:hypothetical protein